MPYSLNDSGALTNMEIDRIVPRTSPGVYVLDKTRIGPFNVNYVGRADDDLNRVLNTYVGSEYEFFKVDFAASPKEAFEKECEIYHDFRGPEGKLDNKIHPCSPANTGWKCPRCNMMSREGQKLETTRTDGKTPRKYAAHHTRRRLEPFVGVHV